MIRRSPIELLLVALLTALMSSCGPPDPPDDDDTTVDDDDTTVDDDDTTVDDDDTTSDDDDAVGPCAGGPLFSEEGLERGINVPVFDPGRPPDQGGRTSVIAADLDGDADLDILVSPTDLGVGIYENDGTGNFTFHAYAVPFPLTPPSPPLGLSAVDLDDDGLADIVQSGFGWAGFSSNLGGMTFTDRELWLQDPDEDLVYLTHQLGDVDGDGDLDLFLPAQAAGGEMGLELALHRIFFQDGGAFDDFMVLEPTVELFDSQAATLGDLDADGDLDVLLFGDQGPTSAILRNDGVGPGGQPVFTDVTAEHGFGLDLAAMGMDGADVNNDGILDWCVTDLGPPPCWVSFDGTFIESGLALGIEPDVAEGDWGTVGWSLELVDFDNDGFLDMAQSSAPEELANSYPDLIWRGLPNGTFEDVSEASGFFSSDPHWGMAAADFDGDGFLDIVTGGNGTIPMLFMNSCTEGAWIEIDLLGPLGNSDGFGSTVEVTTASRTRVRQLFGLRGQGQGPAVLHFGLGDEDDPVTARVSWSDGEETLVDLPTGARHVVSHPSR